ncbi:MAG: hypothetical protein RLZZ546_3016 [Bacteroidota bacterium]|jgi:D-hexose-6-phosphate mutarotase
MVVFIGRPLEKEYLNNNFEMSILIALQGAQIYGWNHPKFGEILWVSEASLFHKGKSIRGGIPICWPWFGPKEGLPQHGFCRTVDWQKEEETLLDGRRVEKYFLQSHGYTYNFFPHNFELTFTIEYGNEMKISLTTKNTDSHPFVITEALHTYFAIGDINQISIEGLNNNNFFDKVNNTYTNNKSEIFIQGEIDNVYENENEISIKDPVLNRRIIVSQESAKNTVVWNPGFEKAKTISDMKPDEYKKFICVESANALKNEVYIESGASHTITQKITIEELNSNF